MKTVLLLLLVLPSLAKAGYSNTDEVIAVRDAVKACDFTKAVTLAQAIGDSKLDYELTPGGWGSQYDSYPKTKMLGYLNSMKGPFDTCDKMPEGSAMELGTKHQCYKDLPSIPENQEFLIIEEGNENKATRFPFGVQTHYLIEACSKPKEKDVGNRYTKAQDKEDSVLKDKQIAENKTKWETQLNSPEGISTQLCNTNKNLAQLNLLLAKQKAATEVSGVANKTELNKLGLAIVNHRESLEAGKVKYKTASGKTWSSSLCK